tara:strand:- start:144 stop:2378 length:2235 start_codon:yes stop_codon:yes gene_type:complete
MAQRKDPLKTNIMSESNSEKGIAFVTFNPDNPEEAANALENSGALESYQAVSHHTAYAGGGARDKYADISTNISVRNEFGRDDYDSFRPGEARQAKTKDNMGKCNRAYKRVGIVRNVIDLMSDFGSQGVKLVHENKKVERFCRRWFTHKINGEEVTERFLNYLYRIGTVVSQRHMCKISLKEERRLSVASDKGALEPTHEMREGLKTRKRVIPCGYTFLNPLTLEIAGGELAQFAGEVAFGLKITGSLRTKITAPKNEMEKTLVAKLPKELVDAVTKGVNLLPLDNSKISSHSYKKDDWDTWASPMLECILDDLGLLEKMKLADLAALDGAISQIRVWKLGDLDKGILPTDAAIQKLADILLSNPGGGAFDLIWGPELSFEEVTTSVHNFLGGTKYEPILDAIHSGLGVPPTLTGSARNGGATNNFVSLQTLIQRLEYGRQQVSKFWQQELELLRQAMGWAKAPSIEFDNMILKDQAAEKALLIQLLDRNLVSEEMVVQMFGAMPELETARKRREEKERKSGKRMEKVGPYSKDKIHELVKVALARGYISPEQAGLEIEDPEAESPFDKQLENKKPLMIEGPEGSDEGPTGKSGEGRPQNSKDDPGISRDRKFKPRTSSQIADEIGFFLNDMSWARQAQSSISSIISKPILQHYQKKNMRSLSHSQGMEVEYTKFRILSNFPKNSIITEKSVSSILASNPEVPPVFKSCYNSLLSSHIKNVNREPTIDELRSIQAATHCLCCES